MDDSRKDIVDESAPGFQIGKIYAYQVKTCSDMMAERLKRLAVYVHSISSGIPAIIEGYVLMEHSSEVVPTIRMTTRCKCMATRVYASELDVDPLHLKNPDRFAQGVLRAKKKIKDIAKG